MNVAGDWTKKRTEHVSVKKKLIEDLIEERKDLHKKHLEQLLHEECEIDTKILNIQNRNFQSDVGILGSLYSSLSRTNEVRRQMELQLWKEIAQFKQLLQELEEEPWK